jgi:plasmid maintenance system antidote protein VapI
MTVLERKKAASFQPNYIRLLPPGEVIAEKITEMGIDETELASRCGLPLETLQKLLKAETPLTTEIADKIEAITRMSADGMIRLEMRYRNDLLFLQQHPDYPVLSPNS